MGLCSHVILITLFKTVNSFLSVPAQILDQLSTSAVTVREGETVNLVCNVTGTPPPTVTWYRLATDSKAGEKQSELCLGSDSKTLQTSYTLRHSLCACTCILVRWAVTRCFVIYFIWSVFCPCLWRGFWSCFVEIL